jgi:hypothetical protein
MRASGFGLICAVCAASTVASTVASDGASAGKVNPVVAKMIVAYGGSAVLSAIKTRVVTVTLPIQGQAGTITTTYARPKVVQVIQIPGLRVTVTYGYDGSRGWTRDTEGLVEEQSDDQVTVMRCMTNSALEAVLGMGGTSNDLTVRSSRSTVDGKQYDQLEVTRPGCPMTTMLVDQTTHLVARETTGSQTSTFSNYQADPAGERYPKTVVTSADGVTTVATVTDVEDNVTVDDSMFAMPASHSSPVPVPGLTPAPTPPPPPTSTVTPAATSNPVTPAPVPTHRP